MTGSASRPFSANQVGLIGALLLLAWVAFFFVPRKDSPTPPVAQVAAVSKLRAVGLTDNPDWEGLPEFFAIWADKAEWKDGRTRFAYWHPVMKTYSYYFEAVRVDGGYRFTEIAEPHDTDGFWDEDMGEDCPIRLWMSFQSPPMIPTVPSPAFSSPGLESVKKYPDKIRVEIVRPDSKIIPLPLEPKP